MNRKKRITLFLDADLVRDIDILAAFHQTPRSALLAYYISYIVAQNTAWEFLTKRPNKEIENGSNTAIT